MCRSKGRARLGTLVGRGRLARCPTIVGRTRSRRGRSCSVFTAQRSSPRTNAGELRRCGSTAGAATRAASATIPTSTSATRRRALKVDEPDADTSSCGMLFAQAGLEVVSEVDSRFGAAMRGGWSWD
jgi:hypothetical protein